MAHVESRFIAGVTTGATLALGSMGMLGAQSTRAEVASATPACDIAGDIANIADHVRNKTPFEHDVLLPQDANETDVKAFPHHDASGEKGLMWNPLVKVCGSEVVRLFQISPVRKTSIGVPHPIDGTRLFVDSVKPKKVLIQGFPGICTCEGVTEVAPAPGPVTLHYKRDRASKNDIDRRVFPGFTGAKGQRYGEQL